MTKKSLTQLNVARMSGFAEAKFSVLRAIDTMIDTYLHTQPDGYPQVVNTLENLRKYVKGMVVKRIGENDEN